MKYADILKHFQSMLLDQAASDDLKAELGATQEMDKGIRTYLSNRTEGFYKIFSRIFPKVQMAVTENNFRILTQEFTKQVSGYEGDIAKYSKAFPRFLGQHPNLEQLEWIEELALLEWIVGGLEYHKPVPSIPTESALSAVALSKNPTLSYEAFDYTVGNFWGVEKLEEADLAYSEEPSYYLVWKNQDLQLVWCDKDQLEFVLPLFEQSLQNKSPNEVKDSLGEELFNVAIEQGWLV